MMHHIVQGGQEALWRFTSLTKRWLIAYFLVTIAQTALDLVTFFIQVKNFGTVDQSAFAGLAMITIASILLYINWYYIFWVLSLQFKFPSHVSTTFIHALFGILENLHAAIGRALFKKEEAQAAKARRQQYEFEQHSRDV